MDISSAQPKENTLVPDTYARLITTPASYAKPVAVHDALTWLRNNDPVGRVEALGFSPFWLVTKQSDILEVERQAQIFHNGDRSTVLLPADMDAAIRRIMNGSPHLTRSMVNMDGPEHIAYRTLTQAWFMPGNVRKLADKIRGIARAHVDRMLARDGSCDFVSDVALHFPLHVIMEILGVPEEDEPRMLMLTQQLFGARDPELSRSADSLKDPDEAARMFSSVIADFNRYFMSLTAKRRAEPRDDVASIIANAVIDGRPISDHEAMSYYILIATAGHDTTSASTSGAMWALAERPDQWARVRQDPSLIPGLVEEGVRWVTPVKHFMRTAVVDYELRGKLIRAGDWVMLSYLSGNRDEEVFDDPFAFRVDRPANKHVAFGYGAHVCLGQHLAKLEMRILWEELLARLDSVELAGEPAWSQSSFVSGPKRLPIKFKAA